MSVANVVSLNEDPLTVSLENRQLTEHNQALAAALREARLKLAEHQVVCQDLKDLEDERLELENELRATREELTRRTAPRPAPPPPPPMTTADKLIVKALKRIVLNRTEESLAIFARLGGLSPSFADFYQKMFHSWVVLGGQIDGNAFARRIVFGLKGKLHERFLRAYSCALDELSQRPGGSKLERRQWLLELAELHLEEPRQAIGYLMRARKAS